MRSCGTDLLSKLDAHHFMETPSARLCDDNFRVGFLQVSCKNHFQFALLWPLLPGSSCSPAFCGTECSKRQEHRKCGALKFAPVLILSLLCDCVTKGK